MRAPPHHIRALRGQNPKFASIICGQAASDVYGMLIAPGYRYHCDDIWHIGSNLHRHFIIVSKVLQNADVQRRATIDPIVNSLRGMSCTTDGVARHRRDDPQINPDFEWKKDEGAGFVQIDEWLWILSNS